MFSAADFTTLYELSTNLFELSFDDYEFMLFSELSKSQEKDLLLFNFKIKIY